MLYGYGKAVLSAGSPQVVVVSNRGAYVLQEHGDALIPKRTVGGLASAVEPEPGGRAVE